MYGDRMVELARALAAAKSRQDVPAAMALFHRDMVLEAPAFGTTARGLVANQKALTQFFASFPDYDVALQGHASDGDALICWGTARMTMTGDRFGVVPNGSRAELPVHPVFLPGRSDRHGAVLFRPVGAVRPIGRLDGRGPAKRVWRYNGPRNRDRIGSNLASSGACQPTSVKLGDDP